MDLERPKRTNAPMKLEEKKRVDMLSETKIKMNIEKIEQKARHLNNVIHAIKRQTELVESLESQLESNEITKKYKFGAKLTDRFSFFESNFTITADVLVELLKHNIEENTTTANNLIAELGIEVE